MEEVLNSFYFFNRRALFNNLLKSNNKQNINASKNPHQQ